MYYKLLFDWIKCCLSILLTVSWCVIKSTSSIYCKYIIYGIYKNPNVNLFNSWKYLTSINEVFPTRQSEIIMIFVKLKCLMIFKRTKTLPNCMSLDGIGIFFVYLNGKFKNITLLV